MSARWDQRRQHHTTTEVREKSAKERQYNIMNNDQQSRWEAPPPPPYHRSSSSLFSAVGGIVEDDEQRRGGPMTATSAVCKFFLRGDCNHGNSCRFSHQQQQHEQQYHVTNAADRHQTQKKRRGYSMDGSNIVCYCLHIRYILRTSYSNVLDVILY